MVEISLLMKLMKAGLLDFDIALMLNAFAGLIQGTAGLVGGFFRLFRR